MLLEYIIAHYDVYFESSLDYIGHYKQSYNIYEIQNNNVIVVIA